MIDGIKIFSAPLQGFTDNVWRNAHARHFSGVDVYCTPFLRIEHGSFRKKDTRDILPANNTVPALLPQILASTPDEVAAMVTEVTQMGYTSIDINMGCPHPPVAGKHKGSGILKYPDEMEKMFMKLSQFPGIKYSVKMRLGWDDNTQWEKALDLLEIIEPVHVTLHPRIGKQQYKGELDILQCKEFINSSKYPVVLNGGIVTTENIKSGISLSRKVNGIMIGRGLLSHPHMLQEKVSAGTLQSFHDDLLNGYAEVLTGGETQLLTKMKTIWEYFLPESDRKSRKLIKKCRSMDQYPELAAAAIRSFDENNG